VVTAAALGGMAAVAFGMALTPGPNMMYLLSRSIAQGRRAALISLAGTGSGFVAYMTLANVGLAAVFVVVPVLYVLLKSMGAAYLLWLAWRALRPGGEGAFDIKRSSPDLARALFTKGLVTNLLNPKAAVMYLALIPQFIRPQHGHVILQGFTLGGVQIAVSMVVNAVLIVLAGGIAAFLETRPGWTRWQRRVTGALLASVAVKLAFDAPAPAGA
jgi:threonine/homoserine/homoserine lactone efflux protein